MSIVSPTEFAARINAVTVSAEDLLRTAAAIHRLPPEVRDWRARALCARQLYALDGEKSLAVAARLEAMTRLLASGRIPAPFAAKTRDDMPVLAASVFHAAAETPLQSSDQGCDFDADTFLARILQHADIGAEEDSCGADTPPSRSL